MSRSPLVYCGCSERDHLGPVSPALCTGGFQPLGQIGIPVVIDKNDITRQSHAPRLLGTKPHKIPCLEHHVGVYILRIRQITMILTPDYSLAAVARTPKYDPIHLITL